MSGSAVDSGALPASCPHCGSTPGDYSMHHSLFFCNTCGKKVIPKNASNASPVNAAGGGGVFSTPPRSVAPPSADGDEEDDIVTFKHSMQSPPPPNKMMSDSDPTPAPPKRTIAHLQNTQMTNESNTTQNNAHATDATMPNQTTAAAAAAPISISAPPTQPAITHHTQSYNQPSAPAAPAAPAGNIITLTEEEFTTLESTIREEVKKEMKSAHDAETEILTMEYDTLNRLHLQTSQEKLELQRTMDEMMESFNKVVDDANARRNDFTAQTGILESEVNQLRNSYNTQKVAFNTMKESHTRLKTDFEEQAIISKEQATQLDKIRADHETLQAKYDKLHKQAHEKLSDAAGEYRNLLSKNAEKDTLINSLTSDLQSARRAKADSDAAHATLSDRVTLIETVAENKTAECLELRSELTQTLSQLGETRVKLDESQAIATRYKEQIVIHRQRLSELEDSSKNADRFEQDIARIENENASLLKENQQLKSQLFDSFQVEKSLKQQLECMPGVNMTNVEDSTRVVRLETELAAARANLSTKEKEHQELMAICSDLISQVETLKAQR